MPTLTLRSKVQALHYVSEIRGQISDGHWENLNVRDHWQPWCDCEVRVGSPQGRDFFVKYDRYGLTSKSLLHVVGNRMIRRAQIMIAFGPELVEPLMRLFDEFEDDCPYVGIRYETKRGFKLAGAYWDGQRATARAACESLQADPEDVAREILLVEYSMVDLKRDLREVSAAMKARV